MEISSSLRSCHFVNTRAILVIHMAYVSSISRLWGPHLIPPAPPPGWPVTIGSEFVPKFYICSHVICILSMVKKISKWMLMILFTELKYSKPFLNYSKNATDKINWTPLYIPDHRQSKWKHSSNAFDCRSLWGQV